MTDQKSLENMLRRSDTPHRVLDQGEGVLIEVRNKKSLNKAGTSEWFFSPEGKLTLVVHHGG